jgi:hypothetical protein
MVPMVELHPNERLLTGRWLYVDGDMKGDQVEERIEHLISNHLQQVAVSPQYGAWQVLYVDPQDGRYWQLSYPNSEMHGGGPKELEQIGYERAVEIFGPLPPLTRK